MNFDLCRDIMDNMSKVIVGKRDAMELLLVGLLAEGRTWDQSTQLGDGIRLIFTLNDINPNGVITYRATVVGVSSIAQKTTVLCCWKSSSLKVKRRGDTIASL